MAPARPQRGPKGFKFPSKRAAEGPKKAPRRPQEGPKKARRGPQSGLLNCHEKGPSFVTVQLRRLGALLGAFWSHLGGLQAPFGDLIGVLSRPSILSLTAAPVWESTLDECIERGGWLPMRLETPTLTTAPVWESTFDECIELGGWLRMRLETPTLTAAPVWELSLIHI